MKTLNNLGLPRGKHHCCSANLARPWAGEAMKGLAVGEIVSPDWDGLAWADNEGKGGRRRSAEDSEGGNSSSHLGHVAQGSEEGRDVEISRS